MKEFTTLRWVCNDSPLPKFFGSMDLFQMTIVLDVNCLYDGDPL